jgi:hypothetical protein
VLRTAQDIFALDKAFFLIEGHPLKVIPMLRTLALTVAPATRARMTSANLAIG